MTITLYDLIGGDESRPFSPHCWKAKMALAHKGLAYASVPTPFTHVPAVEGGVSKTVPVIRDGDRVVADSFAIALYLDEAYPDRPTLFAGEGGKAMARFVEAWTQTQVHPFITSCAVLDIHDMLAPEDQAYFRRTREAFLGRPLEDVPVGREERCAVFAGTLAPMRSMLKRQPFIGGEAPLFPDYIVFGAFQWMRITSPFKPLAGDDPVAEWFERCLDLHGGLGRSIAAAAA